MIDNIYILKNGLPIYVDTLSNKNKNFINDQNFDSEDNITMISGFFSALNSFANTLGDFGNMKEIKLKNVKFTFYIPDEAKNSNLMLISKSDSNTPENLINTLLNRISSKFIRKFPSILKKEWNGRSEIFQTFKKELNEILNEINNNNTSLSNQDLSNHSLTTTNTYYKLIPQRNCQNDQSILEYLSGEIPIKIFNEINGFNTISNIAEKIGVSTEKVWLFCKSFLKQGLIKLN